MKQFHGLGYFALIAALCCLNAACSGGAKLAQGQLPPSPTVTLPMGTFQFASVPKGGTGMATTITVTNTGTAALTFTSAPTVTGPNATDFAIVAASTTCVVGMPIAAGSSCVVVITFDPSIAGNESATLVFADNATPAMQMLPLAGVGTPSGPGVGGLPASVPFGPVPQGTTSQPMAVMLVNTGSGALTFTSTPTITGANAADFAIVANTCLPANPVAAGLSCSVSLTFKPSTNAAESATLNFADDATPATQSVPLTGTGTAPSVSLPASVPFNTQFKGTTSGAMTATLMNTGNGSLTFAGNPSISGANAADFAITASTCSTASPVVAGGSCNVTMKFTPSTAAAENASLGFTDNAIPGNQSVPLTGTGTAPAVTLPANEPFGTIPQGSMSPVMTVTLMNSGTASLTFASNPSISGANAADFVISGMTCSTAGPVVAGLSCTVSMKFTPSTTSGENASLNFTDNANAAPGSMQSVALTGTGSAVPAPVVNLPANEPFGQVPKGSTSPQLTVTLMNTGNASLTFTSNPTVTGANAADFTIVGAMTTCSTVNPVAAGGGCVVVLTFTPSTASAENATLNFADNAAPAAQSVALTGTGTAPAVSLPGSLPFGTFTQGVTSPAKTVTLMNTGNGALVFTSNPSISGANAGDFNITSSSCSTASQVVAGGNCTVMITFKPSTTAGESASLNFADNATPNLQSVNLTGTGMASGLPVVSLPANVQFNGVQDGTTSPAMTVTLTNTGTNTLNFTSNPGISGTNSGDFMISSSTCMTGSPVTAGNTCTVMVTFTPSIAGAENATLNFNDNAAPSSQSVSLQGTGNGAIASVPANLKFNMVPVTPSSMKMTVTFTNTGNIALNFTAAPNVTGPNAADMAITGGTCAMGTPVAANGGFCTVMITFTPNASAIAESASLNFADNAIPAEQVVPLSGTGIHWIGISGTDSPTAGVSSYNVYRGTASGGEGAMPIFACLDISTPTACMDTTGSSGTKYFYFVRAVLSGVESANSNETSAIFP